MTTEPLTPLDQAVEHYHYLRGTGLRPDQAMSGTTRRHPLVPRGEIAKAVAARPGLDAAEADTVRQAALLRERSPETPPNMAELNHAARFLYDHAHADGFRAGAERAERREILRAAHSLLTVAGELVDAALATGHDLGRWATLAWRTLSVCPMVVDDVTTALGLLTNPGGGGPRADQLQQVADRLANGLAKVNDLLSQENAR